MSAPTREFQPNWGVHPGEILGGVLDQRGMRQVELAQRTGLSAKHVNQIVKQTIGISPDVSILLERALDIPASFWIDLDTQYQAFESRRRAEATLGEYGTWASQFDTATLRRHGIIDAADTGIARAEKILKLFQVATPDAFTQTWLRPSVSFRRSQAFTISEPNTALWLRLVERSARDVSVEPFNARKLRAVAKSIPTMTTMTVPNGFVAVRAALAEAGIALTFVREVPGTRVCAATWWIDGDRPAIGITERHRRHDTFWFNLLHEIGHIVRHPRRTSFLDLDGGDAADKTEAEANDFAVETLFPGDISDSIARATTHREMIIIAARLGIGVPMVAGRHGNLTNEWRLVSRLRESISDDDISALETIAKDAVT
ncbi:ImmA/IrrE family metallo-endopeptidase [Streptomyces bobili]|uniref:ImmA/IrrE family metallo-endopeptidase n=1 Tax=Streptomyces bobili TaxID=67280 RepID=UPI0037A18247